MVLHLYHCNRAIVKDKPGSVGRNRPHNIRRYPPRPGLADFSYQPPTDGFAAPMLGSLLALLQDVDLRDEDAVLRVNWSALARQLATDEAGAHTLLQQAYAQHLIEQITIAANHNNWMKQSANKGCLVLMACAEQHDAQRNDTEIAEAVAEVVHDCISRITNASQWLDWLCLVPNVHLAPREPAPLDGGERALEMLIATKDHLNAHFDCNVHLASFGYSKIIDLAINAHPIGYQIRVV